MELNTGDIILLAITADLDNTYELKAEKCYKSSFAVLLIGTVFARDRTIVVIDEEEKKEEAQV